MSGTSRRVPLRAACLGLALTAAGFSADEASPVRHRVPQGESAYFFSNHLTGATFIELRADGTFRTINREHMFIAEMDAGRWTQTPDDEILLCSSYRYRPVVSGTDNLYVAVRAAEDYDRLPALRDDVAAFLDERVEPKVPSRALTKAWPYARSANLLRTYGDGMVERADLEAVLRAIPTYLAQGEANLSRWTPITCGGCVYLLDDEPGADVKETAARVCSDARDGCDREYVPVAIDAERFAQEIGARQPFVHYPEMNELVGSTPASLDDMKGTKLVEPRCGCFPCATTRRYTLRRN